MFVEAQIEQIEKWLLEPRIYALVLALTLLALVVGVERVDRRYWLHTATDFSYGVMNAILYVPLIAVCVAGVHAASSAWMPWLDLRLVDRMPTAVAFVFIVAVDDFLSYVSHVLRHKIRWLWYFHVIHHSQERLNPLTTKRFHPVENLFDKLAIKWIPLTMAGASLETWYIYYALDAAWDYFIHSNLRLNLGPLRYVLVTPQFHRIHHSRLEHHFDRNFSDRFVIWDLLFGTAHMAKDDCPPTGVPNIDLPLERKWSFASFARVHAGQIAWPFRRIARDIAHGLNVSRT